MRTITVVAAALAVAGACSHEPTAHEQAPPPPTRVAVVPADAPRPDAAPDAAPEAAVDAADPDDSFYDHEAIGPLHATMTDKQLIAVLGAPKKREKPAQEGATGQWVSAWQWADASALLVSDHAGGPWQARDVSGSRAGWSTKRGIHVGSTRAEVEKAYPRKPDDPPLQDRDQYVVGSVYGGMLIFLAHDRVTSMSIGVFAF